MFWIRAQDLFAHLAVVEDGPGLAAHRPEAICDAGLVDEGLLQLAAATGTRLVTHDSRVIKRRATELEVELVHPSTLIELFAG